jgi:hypothetical protein
MVSLLVSNSIFALVGLGIAGLLGTIFWSVIQDLLKQRKGK